MYNICSCGVAAGLWPGFICERNQEEETMDWTYPAGAGEEGIYEIGGAPRQKWMPFPNARWVRALARNMSNSSPPGN